MAGLFYTQLQVKFSNFKVSFIIWFNICGFSATKTRLGTKTNNKHQVWTSYFTSQNSAVLHQTFMVPKISAEHQLKLSTINVCLLQSLSLSLSLSHTHTHTHTHTRMHAHIPPPPPTTHTHPRIQSLFHFTGRLVHNLLSKAREISDAKPQTAVVTDN